MFLFINANGIGDAPNLFNKVNGKRLGRDGYSHIFNYIVYFVSV